MATATLPTPAPPRATVEDLMKVEGKAELIGGRVVHLMASGIRPSKVARKIVRSLEDHVDAAGRGDVYGDGFGCSVPELSSRRESFSPDACYYASPLPAESMKFGPRAPDLAVEVRSEHDYGRAAELELAAKRADYFEAGTELVWDVDPVAKVILLYAAGAAEPTRFGPGGTAHAEPVVPGWTLDVIKLFAVP